MSFIKRKRRVNSAQRQPRLMEGQSTNSFRRSRTLTGSVSSKVRAASEEMGKLQSDRLKKQHLKKHQRLLIMSLLGLLLVTSSIYYLLNQYIGSVSVSYAQETLLQSPRPSVYEGAIRDYLGAQPSQRFRFVLNENELSSTITKKHPEVDSISVKRGGMGYADFTVLLRQPTVSWKVGQKDHFVDSNGEIFEKNFFAPPIVNVTDNSGAAVENDKAFVSKGFLRFLGRLVALTNASGLGEVSQASLPANTTRQIDIKIKGRGYTIKTHTDRDPAAEVEDMQRVIGYLDQRKLTPSYIDVRVPGRAYYK